MGVFDKFLDIMKLSDEDDYEDDFFDDEVDEYTGKDKTKIHLKKKKKSMMILICRKSQKALQNLQIK